jgi:glycosyltransferase involved in cell wall biosynthesis
MKIILDNVNLSSQNGPNSFANKMIPYIIKSGHQLVNSDADVMLSFIESMHSKPSIPRIQRLDGIYYNTRFNYNQQNANILRTYKETDGVVFQSEYGKELITRFFGEPPRHKIIHNGADMETINNVQPLANTRNGDIWSCAASWRPHKRLEENIKYFLEHKKADDILIIAGDTPRVIEDPNIAYAGQLNQVQLYSLYKASTNFIHLGWLDCCPNVVVDARACGAHIICTTSGGTKEVAGKSATIITEPEWDFTPIDLYSPPPLDFSNVINNDTEAEYDMAVVTDSYLSFMESFL